jgi:predicted transcriptional regulator
MKAPNRCRAEGAPARSLDFTAFTDLAAGEGIVASRSLPTGRSAFMQKPRVNVHVTEEVWRRLDKVADRPDVSKAAIVDAALMAFLSPEADDKRDAAIIRRLDKIDRRLEKLEEQNFIISEAIGLSVWSGYFYAPRMPEAEREAAQALADHRFQHFLRVLGRQLAKGSSLGEKARNAIAEGGETTATKDAKEY